MVWLVGLLTSSRHDRRHPRWMRRIALAATTAGLLSLGGGYLALGAAGSDSAHPAVAARATSTPLVAPVNKEETVELPPLPQSSRAKTVAPVAGGAVASSSPSSEEAASDAGLTGNDAKPTKAASA